MSDLRKAAEMALEALNEVTGWQWSGPMRVMDEVEAAIYALRTALAQTEQEPVAWGIANTRPTEKNPLMMVMLDEPKPSHLVVPLYTAPPKREWVGLTDDEIDEKTDFRATVRYFEAKLKEKNT